MTWCTAVELASPPPRAGICSVVARNRRLVHRLHEMYLILHDLEQGAGSVVVGERAPKCHGDHIGKPQQTF